MANTKTTAKAKTKVDEPVIEAVDEVVVEQSETQVVKTTPTPSAPTSTTTALPEKRKFENEDPIPCESITVGELRMKGIKSNVNYIWAGRGDVTDVEYQDLVAAIRSSKSQVYSPAFIIKDEEFVNAFPQI